MHLLVLSDLHLEIPAPQPVAVCLSCAQRYGVPPVGKVTWYDGYCGVCRQEARVTEPRVFGDLSSDWNLRLPDPDAYDVVVLAGDIHKHTWAIPWAAGAFPGKKVLYVPGNHEMYGAHLHGLLAEMRKRWADHPNIHLLDNSSVVIDGIRFAGATLWTDFMLHGDELSVIHACMADAKRFMPDFSAIRFGGTGYMTPSDTVKLFRASVTYLREELAKPFDGPTVVVTHHLPSMRSVATRFQDNLISAAFASRLDDLVCKADVWVHGHTHDSFEYEIGKCRVVCNPRGYPTNRITDTYENPMFDAGKIVEVGE